ncbi:MAG: xanthine dehydrogenase molybdopterin binding subunit, partial [Bryobacterales bacterium]|nr:xanthine dehydrogenase molybdopterin binding subunit [Bryobacterales bacterium]
MKIAGHAVPHESAREHVTGEALYTDDLVRRFPGVLHAWPVLSPHAHAFITSLNTSAVGELPDVVTVLTANDVPGVGDCGSSRLDEPLFPAEVMYHSQPVAWVLGETLEAAIRGAAAVRVKYEPLPAILTIDDAITAGAFHSAPMHLARGDASILES